jgi:hypothetical protein
MQLQFRSEKHNDYESNKKHTQIQLFSFFLTFKCLKMMQDCCYNYHMYIGVAIYLHGILARFGSSYE